MVQIYAIKLTLATAGLTVFLVASGTGVVCGGFPADWTDRHDLITISGMRVGALFFSGSRFGGILDQHPHPSPCGRGFCVGHDNAIARHVGRKSTPRGASGRVFGFVYSGLDLGSCLIPLVLGWVLDRGKTENCVLYYCVDADADHTDRFLG
ncbi:MAG: hypothetical protein Ct9H300mP16_03680 [Pseudomonadota bacterium]|nr:MAG: hypothetical protein Ct9H300mP16_03680 [Pseudomonadota bacterium]